MTVYKWGYAKCRLPDVSAGMPEGFLNVMAELCYISIKRGNKTHKGHIWKWFKRWEVVEVFGKEELSKVYVEL